MPTTSIPAASRLSSRSSERQLAVDALAALLPSHPMVALLEFDDTNALAGLRREGTRVSLFAFLVQSIAVTISEHPDRNLIRHGRRLLRFEDVDISVPVEVTTPDGEFPREFVLRRAPPQSPAKIYATIEAARTLHQETGSTRAENRESRRLTHALPFVAASVPSGGDESVTLQVSFGIDGTGPAEFVARVSRPNDDPDQEGDRGPEEVTIQVEFDGAQLFEETYQPEYSEQSRGRGCRSCVHAAYEQATL